MPRKGLRRPPWARIDDIEEGCEVGSVKVAITVLAPCYRHQAMCNGPVPTTYNELDVITNYEYR